MLSRKIVLFIASLTLCSSFAFADCDTKEPKNKFYVGGEYQYVNISPTANYSLTHNQSGLTVFGGYRWDELGAEVGYSLNYNAYIDGIYYYKIAKNLDLKALAGLGMTSVTLNYYQFGYNVKSHSLGIRLGLGGEYYFNQRWSSSLTYKFQTSASPIKYLQTVGLGVAYHF